MAKRSLVVYYSQGGNTRCVAEAIAAKLGCEVEEIKAEGYTPLKDPSGYDLVVVGTPVNGFQASKPIQAYLNANQGRFKEVALYATYSLWPAGTLGGMEKLAGRKPVASATFKSSDIKLGKVDERVKAFVNQITG